MEGTNPERVKRGGWSKQEDILLRQCVEKYGEGRWHLVPFRAGLNRCRKSCRLRWVNYLSPNIKRGYFTTDEVDLLIRLHKLLGNRWSLIAGRIPGRTANDVKNFWNTHVVKMLPSAEKGKATSEAKIIKPKPHNLSKVAVSSRTRDDNAGEEPAQNVTWRRDTAETGDVVAPAISFPIPTAPIPDGEMTGRSINQLDGGDGLSEFSTGFWKLLGFDDV